MSKNVTQLFCSCVDTQRSLEIVTKQSRYFNDRRGKR